MEGVGFETTQAFGEIKREIHLDYILFKHLSIKVIKDISVQLSMKEKFLSPLQWGDEEHFNTSVLM